MSINISWNHGPRDSRGATIGKTIFTYVRIEKKSSPKPAGQLQSNLVQTLSCMMGIQVYSNEGPSPLQRGDNHKSAKIG
jgi:hypothetical protein